MINTSTARRLALAGMMGPAAFALTAAIGAVLEDSYLGGDAYLPGRHGGYSSMYSFVSELAARGSGVQVLMTAGFLVLGVCTLVFAASLRVLWPTATALAVAVAVSGAGTMLAGTFSCDEGCPTEGVRSTSQQLHDLTSVVTFLAWMAAALLAGWRFRGSAYGVASSALGAIQIVAAAVLGAFTDRQADDPVGLVQRISLIAVGTWFVLTARRVRKVP